MNETLKMMQRILNGKEGKANEKELIKEYQEKLSPNILAYFYCNNFGLITKISKRYPIIIDEDKASFCLQTLDICLRKFNEQNNVKFITYFLKCYENKLLNEVDKLKASKRNLDYEYESLICYNEVEDIDFILNNYKLTEKEKTQCKLLNMGYTMTEIANIFKTSISTVSQLNSKIKKKILNFT